VNRHDFKMVIAALIDILIRDAVATGQPTEPIFRALGAESLELAARIHVQHGGCSRTFLGMAADLLERCNAGREQ